MSKDNRREYGRVQVPIRAMVRTGDLEMSGVVTDLSMRGVFVELGPDQDHPEVGAICIVTLHFDDDAIPLDVDAAAVVRRLDEAGVALEITEVGMEAHHRLRRLVLIHAQESGEFLPPDLQSER